MAEPAQGADDSRLEALRSRSEQAFQEAHATWARAQAQRESRSGPVPQQDRLAVSPLARLRARLATMPVIEQAKGILMAQQGCNEQQAFDLLRRASQRANVPVRTLAAELVAAIQQPGHTGPRTAVRAHAPVLRNGAAGSTGRAAPR